MYSTKRYGMTRRTRDLVRKEVTGVFGDAPIKSKVQTTLPGTIGKQLQRRGLSGTGISINTETFSPEKKLASGFLFGDRFDGSDRTRGHAESMLLRR